MFITAPNVATRNALLTVNTLSIAGLPVIFVALRALLLYSCLKLFHCVSTASGIIGASIYYLTDNRYRLTEYYPNTICTQLQILCQYNTYFFNIRVIRQAVIVTSITRIAAGT